MIHEHLQVSNINVFKDYNDLFTGLRVLNTGFEYKVPIDNTVPARCLPPAVPEPRLDDMLPLLTNAKLFSSLDVHAHSKELLTFSTPFGRYRFQQLSFGICSAPELYQMLVSQPVNLSQIAEHTANDVTLQRFAKAIHNPQWVVK